MKKDRREYQRNWMRQYRANPERKIRLIEEKIQHWTKKLHECLNEGKVTGIEI